MSRPRTREIVESVRALGAANDATVRIMSDLMGAVGTRSRAAATLVQSAPGSRPGSGNAVVDAGWRCVELLGTTMSGTTRAIISDRVALRGHLWFETAPSRGAGHLHPWTPSGDPQLPPGTHYAPAPLKLPRGVDINVGLAVQHPASGNCFFPVAVNMLAHRWSRLFTPAMAHQDGGEVVVQVSAGTYRFPATLPVDGVTGEPAHVTSPDGSNLVAYLEKAAAAHFGSYAELRAGYAAATLFWLAADQLPRIRAADISELTDDELYEIMSEGYPLAIGTTPIGGPGEDPRTALAARRDVLIGHAYVATSLAPIGNRGRNPWGRDDSAGLSLQDLRDLGAQLTWLTDVAPGER